MNSGSRTFDGVICFAGGDWWYHNRGHYDMQMMREFSRSIPVLFVNSVGIRVPRPAEGAMFLRRVARKLRSLSRGHVRVRDRFWVLSPAIVPGRAGMAVSAGILPLQVLRAARRMGIRKPLVWVTCPPGAAFVDRLGAAAVIYQRTDRWETYPEADGEQILAFHRKLQERADLTVFCATLLYDEEAAQCRHAAYVDHGVDYETFAAAGRGETPEPPDVSGLPRPRVGFIGGIDASTFDPPLFVEVARRMPDVQFILVGACSLPNDWISLPNVTLTGQRPYEEVAAYMAACDVLIMPWNQSEWIHACNPVKLKEYLAVGRPVVTTPFHELVRYQGFVSIASDASEFAAAIRHQLASPPDPEWLRARVREETWEAKASNVLTELRALGVHQEQPESAIRAAASA
jgi:glycosyltransferase involved in cell wall biosynthesis